MASNQMAEGDIAIDLNGKRHALRAGLDLTSFIETLGLPVQGVLVEYNGSALLRDEWPHVQLADGDRLELLRIVAGG